MRRFYFIAVLTFAAFSGCSSEDDAATPEQSSDGGRNSPENWLTVVSDPADLKQARVLAERLERERLEAILEHLDKAYIGSEEIRLLQAHQDQVRPRLKSLVDPGDISPRSVSAALTLYKLGDLSGLSHLVLALERGGDEERIKVLQELNYGLDDIPKARGDQRLQQVLLAQLDHANREVVKDAIQICGRLPVPGAPAKFAKLLASPNPPDPGRLCYWLSELDPQPDHLRHVIRYLEAKNPSLDHWTVAALSHFAESDDPATSQAARQHLRKIVEANLPQLKTAARFDSERYQLEQAIDALMKHATEDDVTWLKSLLDQPLSSWRKGNILLTLARVGGEEGKTELFQAIQDAELRSSAASALGEAFAETGNTRAIETLVEAAEKSADRLAPIALALNRIGGDGKSAALRLTDRMDGSERKAVLWAVNGWSAETKMDEVVQTGLIDRTAYQKALQEIREGEYYDPEEPIGLESILYQAKLGVAFDAETGELPCRHDRLVLDFAEATQGVFQPTAVSEQWEQRHPDDYEAPYTLQFISEGRLYRAQLRNFGDWYDVERVVQTINRALADAGHPQRFLALDGGGQVAEFLFGDPKAVSSLAAKFQIPLSDELNQAMRLGKEFEHKVIKELDADAL